jgi:molecular chaperone HscB
MDPFAVLGAERRFDVDLAVLEKTHRELSRALHPDKFGQAGPSERRAALEKAATVNEAWRIVRDPIRRAEALFELGGTKVGETNEPKASPAFLMEMLDEREALAEARARGDLDAVLALGRGMAERAKAAEAKLAAGFAAATEAGAAAEGGAPAGLGENDVAKLLPLLGELRFYKRFLDEVSAIEDEALA